MLTRDSRERDFPSLAGRAYLNSAAEGIPPLQVEQALRSYFADHVLGMDGRIAHARWHDALRESVGALYGFVGGRDQRLLLFVRGVQPRGARIATASR